MAELREQTKLGVGGLGCLNFFPPAPQPEPRADTLAPGINGNSGLIDTLVCMYVPTHTLIVPSLDGTSSRHLKVVCAAWLEFIVTSLDGSGSRRLKVV